MGRRLGKVGMGIYFVHVCMSYGIYAVLWIRIGFNADPDFAFYINADPNLNPDPLIQEAKPCRSGSWSNFKVTKVELLNVKYLLILVKFHAPGSESKLPIRIRIQDSQSMRIHADQDPQHCTVPIYVQFLTYRKVLRHKRNESH